MDKVAETKDKNNVSPMFVNQSKPSAIPVDEDLLNLYLDNIEWSDDFTYNNNIERKSYKLLYIKNNIKKMCIDITDKTLFYFFRFTKRTISTTKKM